MNSLDGLYLLVRRTHSEILFVLYLTKYVQCKVTNTQFGSSLVLGALTLIPITTIEIIQRMIQAQWNSNKLDASLEGSLEEHSIRRETHTAFLHLITQLIL